MLPLVLVKGNRSTVLQVILDNLSIESTLTRIIIEDCTANSINPWLLTNCHEYSHAEKG